MGCVTEWWVQGFWSGHSVSIFQQPVEKQPKCSSKTFINMYQTIWCPNLSQTKYKSSSLWTPQIVHQRILRTTEMWMAVSQWENWIIAAYINAQKTHHKKLHVQMVFLMMNTWCLKHLEDTKNWIKTLILKSVHFVGLHYTIEVHINYKYVGKWKTDGSLRDSLST
jgi:hypothetical protein